MTINYASKYSDKVDERFVCGSLTNPAFGQDFDWEGVSTVSIYTLGTTKLNDYKTNGGVQRYGDIDELASTVQTLSLTQDKSFTFTIDRRNYEETMLVAEAGRMLRRQIDEVVVPAVDKYRLNVLASNAGLNASGSANYGPYEAFLDGLTALLDRSVPLNGTVAFASPNFYKRIRLDDGFIKASDLGQSMLVTGQVGMIENVPLIYTPTSYLPEGVEFILTNKLAAVSPIKLTDYKIHDNPPGINGWLVEGRVYYDAFVLEQKRDGVYVFSKN